MDSLQRVAFAQMRSETVAPFPSHDLTGTIPTAAEEQPFWPILAGTAVLAGAAVATIMYRVISARKGRATKALPRSTSVPLPPSVQRLDRVRTEVMAGRNFGDDSIEILRQLREERAAAQ